MLHNKELRVKKEDNQRDQRLSRIFSKYHEVEITEHSYLFRVISTLRYKENN